MTAEEAIKKIKIALGLEQGEFAEAKLADGITIVTWEGDLMGASLMVIGAEGKVPAEDGEYTLEDGRKITVSEGKVSAVSEAEPAETEIEIEMSANPEEKEEVVEEELANVPTLESIHTMVKECMAKIAELETKIAAGKVEEKVDQVMSEITATKSAFAALVEVVDLLAKSPSAEPVEKPDLFSSMRTTSNDQIARAQEMVEAMKNWKK